MRPVTFCLELIGQYRHVLTEARVLTHMLKNKAVAFSFQEHIFNIKSCPCAQLIKHYAMKAYGGVDV
jgi:hypothetical protein